MQWVCASLLLFTHTWPLNLLICILSCGAILHGVLNLCVTLYSLLMLENTLFRLCQINSFFTGYLSNCICQASPNPPYIPSASCFVLSVLSFSPQKQKWFLGSSFQLSQGFLVGHHGTSKDQRSLKNYIKWKKWVSWQNSHVFVQAHSCIISRYYEKCVAELGCKGCVPHPFHRYCRTCSHVDKFFCLPECWLYVRADSEDTNQNLDCVHGKTQ